MHKTVSYWKCDHCGVETYTPTKNGYLCDPSDWHQVDRFDFCDKCYPIYVEIKEGAQNRITSWVKGDSG